MEDLLQTNSTCMLWPMEELQQTHPISTGQRPEELERHGAHTQVKTASCQATAVEANPERSMAHTRVPTQELR
eukprot:6968443-Karenia_brevis.AAC.1